MGVRELAGKLVKLVPRRHGFGGEILNLKEEPEGRMRLTYAQKAVVAAGNIVERLVETLSNDKKREKIAKDIGATMKFVDGMRILSERLKRSVHPIVETSTRGVFFLGVVVKLLTELSEIAKGIDIPKEPEKEKERNAAIERLELIYIGLNKLAELVDNVTRNGFSDVSKMGVDNKVLGELEKRIFGLDSSGGQSIQEAEEIARGEMMRLLEGMVKEAKEKRDLDKLAADVWAKANAEELKQKVIKTIEQLIAEYTEQILGLLTVGRSTAIIPAEIIRRVKVEGTKLVVASLVNESSRIMKAASEITGTSSDLVHEANKEALGNLAETLENLKPTPEEAEGRLRELMEVIEADRELSDLFYDIKGKVKETIEANKLNLTPERRALEGGEVKKEQIKQGMEEGLGLFGNKETPVDKQQTQ